MSQRRKRSGRGQDRERTPDHERPAERGWPGSDQPGSDQPPDYQPGGYQPSDYLPGDQPTSYLPSSGQPDGYGGGGDWPRGDRPDGDWLRGDQPGGDWLTGDQPGANLPRGDWPGSDRPATDWPGDSRPANDWPPHGQAANDRPGGDWLSDEPDADRRGGRKLRIVLSAAAAVLVVLGLGAYGVARLQQGSSVAALQDSASAPCPGHASSATTHCASSAPGAASRAPSAAPSPSASPSATKRVHKHKHKPKPISSSPVPTPTPTPTRPPAPAPSPVMSTSAPTGTTSGSAASQVLAVINQARGQAGLPAYTVSSGLDTSSQRHTTVMASGCGLSHQCPGEAALGDRLTAAGVHWTSAGENIGEGGPEADTTADIAKMAVGLTQSMLAEQPPDDGHRLNILSSSFHHIGIDVFRDSKGTVWMTQDFSN
jgi:uncharacterized protein YkwD